MGDDTLCLSTSSSDRHSDNIFTITGRVVTPRKLAVSKGSKGYEGGIKEDEASVTSTEK